MRTSIENERADVLAQLAPFVPAWVHRALAREPGRPRGVTVERFPAAVLFADISGFTKLTERYADQGPVGAETLQKVLKAHFSPLVELVAEHGGDVLQFAGDATFAIWPAEGDDLTSPTRRATQCALALQSQLDDHREDFSLRCRVVVSAGSVWTAMLGGVEEQWISLLGGSPLAVLETVSPATPVGQVALTTAAWELVADHFVSHSARADWVQVEKPVTEIALEAAATLRLPAAAEEGLRAFIPKTIQSILDAGQTEWLAEFRRVTVLFAELSAPDGDGAETEPERLQPAVKAIQQAIYRYDGSINQLLIDDKGKVLVAAWGVALHSHEDDATRAVLAAMDVRGRLHQLGFTISIGITTGKVFVGRRGNPRRLEYAMLGDVVNMSARLMKASDGGVLCDSTTCFGARGRILFEELPKLQVKGKSAPIDVARPLGRQERRTGAREKIIDRDEQRRQLVGKLFALESDEAREVLLLEGDAGIGKSRLVAYLLQEAHNSNVRSLVGNGDAIESATAYFAWRQVFAQLLRLESGVDADEQRQRILRWLGDVPDIEERLPLLNPLMPVRFPENDTVRAMTAQDRSQVTRELLAGLFARASEGRPTLLVLDDAQWLDSASWALANTVLQESSSVLIVVVTRPLQNEGRSPEMDSLLQRAERIHVGPLSREHSLSLVCQKLDINTVPRVLAELIDEKAEGHPLFTEELTLAMRDGAMLQIEKGKCKLAAEPGFLATLDLPDKLHSIVTSRIDHLSPPEQLTLKVASVVGRRFGLDVVAKIHPLAGDATEVSPQLQAIESLHLIDQASKNGTTAYQFKHLVTQEVTYSLLPFAQRQKLHQAVAEWYEKSSPEVSPALYPLLAHHWGRAEDKKRTLHYLEAAGLEALKKDANPEARSYFLQIRELGFSDDLPKVARYRTARIQRLLGESYFQAGELDRAAEELIVCLRQLKHPWHDSGARRFVRLFTLIATQFAHLVLPRRWIERRTSRRREIREASRAAGLLSWIKLNQNDPVGVFSGSLLSTNLAQRAGTVNVGALGILGHAAATAGLQRLARAYFDHGKKMGHELNELRQLADLLIFSGLYRMGQCELAAAEERFKEGLALAQRISYSEGEARLLTVLASLEHFKGNEKRSRDYVRQAKELPRANPTMAEPYFILGVLATQSNFLPPEETYARFERERKKHLADIDPKDALLTCTYQSTAARIYTLVGQVGAAVEAADQATHFSVRHPGSLPPSMSLTFEYPLESYFLAWETWRDEKPERVPKLEKAARRTARAFSSFAKKNPLVRHRSLLAQGRIETLSGNPQKAARALRASLAIARDNEMPVDQARILLALVRCGELPPTERAAALETARAIFAAQELPNYLMEVEELSASDSGL